MIRLIVYVQTRAMLPLTANFVLIDRTGGMAAGREFGYVGASNQRCEAAVTSEYY